MNILIVTYNRPSYLSQLIAAVAFNDKADIYIYIDGPKCESDRGAQESILELLFDKGFNSENIFHSSSNLGINKSIPQAIEWVFNVKDLDGILVLEDDCIPSPSVIYQLESTKIGYLKRSGIISVTNYFPKLSVNFFGSYIIRIKIPTIWGWYVSREIWSKIDIFRTYIKLPDYKDVIWGTNVVFNLFFLTKLYITKYNHRCLGRLWGTWDNYLSLSVRKNRITTFVFPFNAVSNIGLTGSNTDSLILKRNFNRKYSMIKPFKIKYCPVLDFCYSSVLSIIYFLPATVKLLFYLILCIFQSKKIEKKNYI